MPLWFRRKASAPPVGPSVLGRLDGAREVWAPSETVTPQPDAQLEAQRRAEELFRQQQRQAQAAFERQQQLAQQQFAEQQAQLQLQFEQHQAQLRQLQLQGQASPLSPQPPQTPTFPTAASTAPRRTPAAHPPSARSRARSRPRVRRQDSQGNLRDFVQTVGDAAERAFEGLAAVGRRASIDVRRAADPGTNSLGPTSQPRQTASSYHGSVDHLAPPSPHEHPLARLKRAARSATDVRLNSHTLSPSPSATQSGRFPTSPGLQSGMSTPRGGSVTSASASAEHLPSMPSQSHPPSARKVVASASRTARTSFESLRKLGRKASLSHSVAPPSPHSPAAPTAPGEDPWGDPFATDSPSPSASYRSEHTQPPHRSRPSTATSTSTTSTRLLPLALPAVSPSPREKPSRSSTANTSISSPSRFMPRRKPHTSQASSESRGASSVSGSGPASVDGLSVRGLASSTGGSATPTDLQSLGGTQTQPLASALQRRERELPPPPESPPVTSPPAASPRVTSPRTTSSRATSPRATTSPHGLGIAGLESGSTTPTLPHLGMDPSPTLPNLTLDQSPLVPGLSSILSPSSTRETPTTRLSRLAETMAEPRREVHGISEETTPVKSAPPALVRPPSPATSEEEDPLTGLMAAYNVDAADFDEENTEGHVSDTLGSYSGDAHDNTIAQAHQSVQAWPEPASPLGPIESARPLHLASDGGAEPRRSRDGRRQDDREDDRDLSPPPTGRSSTTVRAFTPPTPAARRVSSRRRSHTSSARWSVGSGLRKRDKGNIPPMPSTPRTPRTAAAPLTPGGLVTPPTFPDGEDVAPPLPTMSDLTPLPTFVPSASSRTVGDGLLSPQADQVLYLAQADAHSKHLDANTSPSPRHERQSIESSLLDGVGPIPPSPLQHFSSSLSMPGRRPSAVDGVSVPSSLKHLAPFLSAERAETLFTYPELIGEGECGDVYCAEERLSSPLSSPRSQAGGQVAIKVVRHSTPAGEARLAHLATELALWKKGSNDRVVALRGVYLPPPTLTLDPEAAIWLVQELMDRSVADVLASLDRTLSEGEVARIIADASDALAYLHQQGIVHRDFRSDNLLLAANGVTKLTDFTHAAHLPTGEWRTSVVGTPFWMAPEVISSRPYRFKADIWSLGAVLWELVEGTPPYIDLPPREAVGKIALLGLPPLSAPHSLSAPLRALLAACTDLLPDARPTAQAVRQDPFLVQAAPYEQMVYLLDLVHEVEQQVESDEE